MTAGYQEHWNPRFSTLYLFREGISVHPWHLQVRNDELEFSCFENRQRFLGISRDLTRVPQKAEKDSQQISNSRFIIHRENVFARHNLTRSALKGATVGV